MDAGFAAGFAASRHGDLCASNEARAGNGDMSVSRPARPTMARIACHRLPVTARHARRVGPTMAFHACHRSRGWRMRSAGTTARRSRPKVCTEPALWPSLSHHSRHISNNVRTGTSPPRSHSSRTNADTGLQLRARHRPGAGACTLMKSRPWQGEGAEPGVRFGSPQSGSSGARVGGDMNRAARCDRMSVLFGSAG
jgi:hypothetical protein